VNRVCFSLVVAVSLSGATGLGQARSDGFVLVKGGTFRHGAGGNQGVLARVEDFEILDHPVTNAEYKVFVDATGYHAPLHWEGGRIPAGKEDYPVIFVNRVDVQAYLRWMTAKEGRGYRLPTFIEFEYAARGGLTGKNYPWGDEDPEKRANYDAQGNRHFDRWKDYLQPARSGEKNGYGLYGMAGNIWQMAVENHDPVTQQYEYRIMDPAEIESAVMGGSWARAKSYLKCGYRLSISAGIRHPDVGFRPVREPQGADWTIQNRKLTAVSLGGAKVLLSWALLAADSRSTCFHVYRAEERSHAGFRISKEPVSESTTFVDSGLKEGKRYQYYVRAVDSSGNEGKRSEWAGATVIDKDSSTVVTFEPLFKQGVLVPVFGDLDGDGTVRWSIYRQHPDIVSIHDYLPERPGLEVFFIVESSVHAGVYMVDASSGEVIWKVNREDDPRWTHGHEGWSADIWAGSPGMECVSNRAGHDDHNLVLFSADGRVLLEPFPDGFLPLEWDGDPTRELLDLRNHTIGDFDGKTINPIADGKLVLPPRSEILMTADLYGDFRDEIVVSTTTPEGKKAIAVITAVHPISSKYVTATDSLDYRLWLARNMGGGYRSVYDHPLR
jgi:formylglycine-generating enzyme required for sulfatase activity